MNEKIIKLTAVIGLIIGGIFGMAGSFAPTDSLRCIAWNIDGVGLTVACSLLTVFYFKKKSPITATGFLVFAIGECFILASNGIHIDEHVYTFGIGVSLWAISLIVISTQKIYPIFVRCTGFLSSVLFSIVAMLISHHAINPLTKPLPFFAYPFFVMTILGWAWKLAEGRKGRKAEEIKKRLVVVGVSCSERSRTISNDQRDSKTEF